MPSEQQQPRDRYIRRSAADYAQALKLLLPTGPIWPRQVSSRVQAVVRGLAQVWGDWVDTRAGDLLIRESDPRQTYEILPEWERAWGLPDPCFTEPLTISDRQRVLVQRMTLLGGQSWEFYQQVIADLGYELGTVQFREYAPFMFGVSQCGNTKPLYDDVYYRWEIGPPEIRFYWTVYISAPKLVWFRFGWAGGQCGVDHHLTIGLAQDLQCILNRWKPAHTKIVFNYSVAPPGMADFHDTKNAALYPIIWP